MQHWTTQGQCTVQPDYAIFELCKRISSQKIKSSLVHFSLFTKSPGGVFESINRGRKSRDTAPLKRQCNEIFDLNFFHESNPSGPLINRLK